MKVNATNLLVINDDTQTPIGLIQKFETCASVDKLHITARFDRHQRDENNALIIHESDLGEKFSIMETYEGIVDKIEIENGHFQVYVKGIVKDSKLPIIGVCVQEEQLCQ